MRPDDPGTYDGRVEVATLVVKLASRCNMGCDYCYIYRGQDTSWMNMPTVMPQHVLQALVRQVEDLHARQQTKPQVVFHGGEPLLMHVEPLRAFVEALVDRVPSVSLSIQTNGTVYTEGLQDLLLAHRRSLTFSVSVDGFKKENDRHRLGLRNESVYRRIATTLQKSRDAGVLDNILMVVDVRNEPNRIYEFMRSTGSKSYNVLLQDGDYDHLPAGKASLGSTEAGDWLWHLFSLYASGPQHFRIKHFDDLAVSLLMKGRGLQKPTATYAHCTITVDTDGEIKQADTYRINAEGADRLGGLNILSDSIFDAANSSANRRAVRNAHELASKCISCEYIDACGGGYPTHRWKSGELCHPSIYCSDYMTLFRAMESVLCH